MAEESDLPGPIERPKRDIDTARRDRVYTLTLQYLDKPKTDPDMEVRNAAFAEMPYVSTIRRMSPNAEIRSWTNNGVYQEHAGFVQTGFTLSGRSGAQTADLKKFYNFLNLLDQYARESAANLSAFVQERPVRLVAHFPFEQERFWVDVVTFEYQRTHGSSTMSYEWTITLVTNGKLSSSYSAESFPQWKALEAGTQVGEVTPFPAVTPAKTHTSLTADPARTQDDQIKWSKTLRQRRDRVTASLMSKVPLSARTVNTVASALKAGKPIPPGQLATLLSAVDGSLLEAYTYYASIPRTPQNALVFATEAAGLTELMTWLNAGKAVLEVMMGLAGYKRTPDDDPYARHRPQYEPVGDTIVNGTAATRVVVEHARTVREVAASMRMSDRIEEIMRLNGMVDSTTLGNGRAIEPGTVLLVPSRTSAPLDALGTDLALTQDGNLVVEGDDIGTVSGLSNLNQSLSNRMRTRRGRNKAFPSFGMPSFRDEAVRGVAAAVLVEAEEQVLRDHRVVGVDDLSVAVDGGAYAVAFTVKPVTGSNVPVNAARSESA